MINDGIVITNFGKRLKAARMERKMTQEQLGNAIGADKSRICDYENGHRCCSIIVVSKLAKALNVPCGNLLDDQQQIGKEGGNCSLSFVLNAIGHAIVDWDFHAYADDNFADYSTMFSIGSMDDSFGDALRQFKNLASCSTLSNENKNAQIRAIADSCAEKMLKNDSSSAGKK